MAHAVVSMSIALLMVGLALAVAFLLGWHLHRRQAGRDGLSPVSRQHIELFQGAPLNRAVLDAAKSRFQDLLERGDVAAIELTLRAGVHFVFNVRALAEIGTEEAGRILERQLQRRHTDDPLEQSWYWIDLATGLRHLNRPQSIPHLLRCLEAAGDSPLGHYLAAETTCFLGFTGYLHQPETPLGRAALRTLHRALEGLRFGVQPQFVVEARLGELIETLWDGRPEPAQPLIVRIFFEALRQLRRAGHFPASSPDDAAEHEAYQWQMSRIAALEGVLQEYLSEAPRHLCAALAAAAPAVQAEILHALNDLRTEAAPALLPLLADPGFPHPELGVRVLTWSRDPRVGPWLREWTADAFAETQRRKDWRRALDQRRKAPPAGFPYTAVLRALRGHPSAESEQFLLAAVRDGNPGHRAAALAALGWWEPYRPAAVNACLQEMRRDPNPDVRQSARAALARLGERQALQGFRLAISSDDPQRVHEAVQLVADEGLTLLWPDLDRLADAEDPDLARFAREALEQLGESLPRHSP